MPIPLGILAAAGFRPTAGGSYELIETITVGSTPVTSITFSNLNAYSSIYEHLQIRTVIFSNQANLIPVVFNNSTTATTNSHALRGRAGSVTSFNNPGTTGRIEYSMYCGNSSIPSNSVVDILDVYSTTKNKTIRSFTSLMDSGTPEVGLYSGFAALTDAIHTITIPHPNAFNFLQGSRFSIYGLKN